MLLENLDGRMVAVDRDFLARQSFDALNQRGTADPRAGQTVGLTQRRAGEFHLLRFDARAGQERGEPRADRPGTLFGPVERPLQQLYRPLRTTKEGMPCLHDPQVARVDVRVETVR